MSPDPSTISLKSRPASQTHTALADEAEDARESRSKAACGEGEGDGEGAGAGGGGTVREVVGCGGGSEHGRGRRARGKWWAVVVRRG